MESIYQKIPFTIPFTELQSGVSYTAKLLNRATGTSKDVTATATSNGTANFEFTSTHTGDLSIGVVCLLVYTTNKSAIVYHEEKYATVYETKIS